MNRDKFGRQFAILCILAILATSAVAAGSVPMLFGKPLPMTSESAGQPDNWWDVLCRFNFWDWDFCPQPIKEIAPPPSDGCDFYGPC